MKITDVKIENFLTIGDAVKLNLDNQGMVLIAGDNCDDTSAVSNGAGKSTIGDAICWALYGITARGETGDNIVNNIVNKDCKVALRVIDGDAMYRIIRHRKHKTEKNSLMVLYHPDCNDILTYTNVTKGTDKLTQDLVNKIMGCSVEVFRSAIYAGQDSIPNLPGMTDKNLKEIVEEAAGINRLGEAHVIAREELKIKESVIAAETLSLVTVRKSILDIDHELGELAVKEDDFDGDTKNKVSGLIIHRDAALKAWQNIEKMIDGIDETALDAELNKLQIDLNGFLATKSVADDHERKTSKSLATAESLLRTAAGVIKTNTAKLESIQDRIGKPCDECGKPYCEEDLESAAEIAKKHLLESKKEAVVLKSSWEAAKTAQNDALTAINALGNITAAVADTKAAADKIHAELDGLKSLQVQLNLAQRDIDTLDKQINELSAAKSPYLEMIKKKEERLDELKQDELKLIDAADEATVARDLAADAVKVFSPAGVRAHIIDTVTPHLNDRTAHYLTILSDGNISAVWNTLSKTKTGELREKFVIEVMNEKGSHIFGGLSGGEKRKVRLATALALQDLVASRASKPIDLFIGDELDDAVDEAGLERLMMLLEEKAREKGTLLVISHNQISDWCSNVATVIKEGGFSRVEGALVV